MMIKTCGECPYIISCQMGVFGSNPKLFSVPDNCPWRGEKIEWPEKVEEIPTK